MNNIDTLNQQISEIESKVAHQDTTIQDISEIALKQWNLIDELVIKVENLKERIRALENHLDDNNKQINSIPPHY